MSRPTRLAMFLTTMILVISACGEPAGTSGTTTTVQATPTTVAETTTTTPAPTTTTTTVPAMSRSQENAVRSAESYLNFTSFSRQGLIDQLMFEDYPEEDAEFAVEYLDVDWNEQAWLKAESYLDYTSFSRQGLIDQLLFEGFTEEQAVYGVDQTGL